MTPSSHRRFALPHPIIVMLLIIVAAGALTWVVPSGEFKRGAKGLVVPGTYAVVDKPWTWTGLLVGQRGLAELMAVEKPAPAPGAGSVPAPEGAARPVAEPAGLTALLAAIPAGMIRSAGLISMIMFIGGMFGVLKASGALVAGIERLVAASRGNIYLLAPVLMVVISAGSTFLGLISEYLLIIPMVLLLGERLGLNSLYALAIVAIPAKVGYIASVTNPLPLVIAQPMLGLPVFSGSGLRLVTWIVLLTLGIAFLLWRIRNAGVTRPDIPEHAVALSSRHTMVLVVTGLAVIVLCYGASALKWGNAELGAFYIAVAMVIAVVAGLDSRTAAASFLEGMEGMVLAGLLIGLAAAVDEILRGSMVLNSIIHDLSELAHGHSPAIVANIILGIEMVLGVLIPSISGKAAISMPILGPIAQLSGVSPQTTVLAFLYGSGITNMISPTSGLLLAYVAAGKTDYISWVAFIWPLMAAIIVVALAMIGLAVAIGY